MLEAADRDELNFILAHNNAATLLEVAAEKTIDALTSRSGRLRDLTTLSRQADTFPKLSAITTKSKSHGGEACALPLLNKQEAITESSISTASIESESGNAI